MNEKKCPLCKLERASTFSGNFDNFNCELCGGVYVDSRLVQAPTTLDNWVERLGAVRELHEEYHFPPTVFFDGTVCVKDDHGVNRTIMRLPSSIRERAHTLLTALVRRSKFFGDLVELNDRRAIGKCHPSIAGRLASLGSFRPWATANRFVAASGIVPNHMFFC